jgi:altronate dehydratase
MNRNARWLGIGELVLGVKCGASDAFSGISANPSLGRAADILIRSHGTVLITEVPEFCGAEHVLAHRAKDAETGRAVYRMVDWYREYAKKFGTAPAENPSPGNVAGGLLNITIKSLGAIAKAGTTRIEGVVGIRCDTGVARASSDAGARLRSGIDTSSCGGREQPSLCLPPDGEAQLAMPSHP